jgi:hypothetical protein
MSTLESAAAQMIDSQLKQDLAAAGAILFMFLGAFILAISPLGLFLIGAGAVVLTLLILKAVRREK